MNKSISNFLNEFTNNLLPFNPSTYLNFFMNYLMNEYINKLVSRLMNKQLN